ncbi:hypothetical protein PPYR_13191 [Photinus pyralis]|uniref:AMP-dependent synthetase/ligase domain-containing protein n=1 Tax=Photinus pyralis TaxID=7054 RepID=A0A5N4A8B5_PHOPY|nr:hypothetical protein PPYR_13191 [Photinus pyralis]
MELLDGRCNDEDEYVVKGERSDCVPEPKGLGYEFFEVMSRYRLLRAQVDAISGMGDTYGSLLERSVATAIKMRKMGIKSKDVITVCGVNHLNSCVPIIAALFVGAVPACLDPLWPKPEITRVLNLVKPKIVFVDQALIEVVEDALSQTNADATTVTFGDSEKYAEFKHFVAEKPDVDFHPYETSDNRETACVFFSSGSTGFPQGISLSHRALLGQANVLVSSGLCFDTSLSYATQNWISSAVTFFPTILAGGCRVIVPAFAPQGFWELQERFSVTFSVFSSTQAIALVKHGRPNGVDTSHLRDLLIGGALLSAHHLQALRELCPSTNCSIAYGLTECSGIVITFNRLSRREIALMYAKPGSSGLISADFACKIVNPRTGATLGPNQNGELCMKSDYVMNGYYGMDSKESLYPDGWLRTGDLGYYDQDRCFYILGRLTETFKFKDYDISPALIEGTLVTHPLIQSAIVIGIPDEESGNQPLAVVCVTEGCRNVGEEEVVKYVEERMPDQYRLRGGGSQEKLT